MLFKRRSSPSLLEKTRAWAWPTTSFARSAQYFGKRVLRVNATPYAIAMGVAIGAFVSFTPLLGLHFLLALALAYLLRANVLASMLGTAVGNPITFPFIWALTFRVGRVILGSPVHHAAQPQVDAPSAYTLEAISGFFERAWPVIKPMLVGSIPLGLTAAAACYAITYGTVVGYQKARASRVQSAAARRAAKPSDTR